MKKLLKFLGIFLVLVLAALIVIPIIFKDDIVKLVKEETNNTVNAKVDFGDFDLSLIKSFPDFYFGIENISVTGVDKFEGVELASLKELELIVDVMSVIKGEAIQVKKIGIVEPSIHAKVLADGSANYLIVEEDTTAVVEEPVEESTEESSFKLQLQEIKITGGSVVYDDATLPVHMEIDELNLDITGDLTENITNIKLDGGVDEINLTFDGIQYMKKTKVLLDVAMAMNLEEFKFTFNENEIMVNELPLGFDGWLAMPSDPIEMDFTFHAKETDFKELLSMIPAAFAQDLEGVKTEGTLALEGYAKGTYIDSTYPAFGLNMEVKNAMFQYPDLPESVDDIQIKASVETKDGDLDHLVVDVPQFHLKMAKNPFDLNFYLATPMSDPFIKAGFMGKLVLDNIKNMVPLEKGDEIAGTINANLNVEGNVSTLEEERYEEFKAKGTLLVEGMHFASDSLDYPIDLKEAAMEFTPQYVELSKLSLLLGKSDLSAQGRLENFIAYALQDGQVLKGSLNVQSSLLDINELAGIDPEAEEETIEGDSTVSEEPLEVVVLPGNIDFVTQASINKLTFDNINIENIEGKIVFREQKVSMENTQMDLLDGSMNMTGYYETSDSTKPTYDFGMDIKNFDVKQTVETFNSVEKLAPLAKKSEGKYSTKMTISGALDSKMEPIYESMFGSGNLNTQGVSVNGYEPLQKIGKAIKYEKLDPLAINDVAISFKISEGKVFIEPFTNKIGDTKMTIAGSNSFDQTIDYVFSFEVPRSEFGSAANDALDGLLSQASAKGVDLKMADVINIDVRLVGPADNPSIKTDFSKTTSNATDALKEKAKEEFDKKKEELEQKAKEELEKQKKELEDKARKEAEKKKKELEEQAKKEIEKQKDAAKKKLEEEAKKKLKGLFK